MLSSTQLEGNRLESTPTRRKCARRCGQTSLRLSMASHTSSMRNKARLRYLMFQDYNLDRNGEHFLRMSWVSQ